MAQYVKQALVIGNDTYVQKRLDTCVNDAIDLTNRLHSMGFEVKCGTNSNFNFMLMLINQFVASIQPGSIAMFYFAGHGVQYNGINYLIPTHDNGIYLNNLDTSTINVQKLIQSMHRKRPRLILIILDCCRAYPSGQVSNSRDLPNANIYNMTQGLAPMQLPAATIIAYACAADSIASSQSKNNRNGLYTYHLLRRIGVPNVDIDLVLRKVALDVQKDPLNVPPQIPFRYSSCNEIICLAGNQPINPTIPSEYFQRKPIDHPHRKPSAAAVHHRHNYLVPYQINRPINNMGSPRNGIIIPIRPVYAFPNQFYQ